MKNLTNNINLLVENLANAMQQKKLPKTLRDMVLQTLNKHPDTITIKAKKLFLTKDFYESHIKMHNLDSDNYKKNSLQYNFFLKLKKYALVHPRSSYYSKKLSLISINPNPAFIYKVRLSDVDIFLDAKEGLYHPEENTIEQQAYNDLRLFQATPLSAKEILKIDGQKIIFLDDETALLYFKNQSFMASSTLSYYLIRVSGKSLIEFFKLQKEKNIDHPFIGGIHEEVFQIFKENNFGKLHISYIKMIGQNTHIYNSAPVHTVLNTSRNIMSKLNISEIDHLYPGKVPSHLLESENTHIEKSLKRPSIDDIDEESEPSLFSLQEFEQLETLRKIPLHEKTLSRKQIPKVITELEAYLTSQDCSKHHQYIVEYILFLIERTENKHEIRLSTFKGYLGLLDKHLFQKVSNLENIQQHELQNIFDNLYRLQYKQKSIRKIRGLISGFFSYHSKTHNINLMDLSTYPKSLVFADEIDSILERIEVEEREKHTRLGNRSRFIILQRQALILLAFYTGARKNELRSRLLSDLFYAEGESKFFLDINTDGMKKVKLQLKTSNAKRRISFQIDNLSHLKIIIKFLKYRKKIKNKSPYLFLHIKKESNQIKSKVMKESIFDELTTIIQSTTKRYASFHSLRHSYASYEALKILNSPVTNIYSFIDLSTKMGHESPEITFKIYVHATLILLTPTSTQRKEQ